MPDAGDDRNPRSGNCPRDDLLIEFPEIFERASSASKENHVDLINEARNRSAQPADKVTISWRPEDLVPYAADLRNRLEGKILRAIFMGNLTNLFVDVNGIVLVAQAPGARAWQAGEAIVLGLSPEKIQILR